MHSARHSASVPRAAIAATIAASSGSQSSHSPICRIAHRNGTSSAAISRYSRLPSYHGQAYSSAVAGRAASGACMWPSTNGTASRSIFMATPVGC